MCVCNGNVCGIWSGVCVIGSGVCVIGSGEWNREWCVYVMEMCVK